MPQIRPASPDDAAAIARIDQLCNGWPAERIRERIRESLEQPSEDWAVFVAEDGQAELEVPQRTPDLSVSHQSGILYRLYL